MMKFDHNFVQSSRKERATKGTPVQQLEMLRSKDSTRFWVMQLIHPEVTSLLEPLDAFASSAQSQGPLVSHSNVVARWKESAV